MNIKILMPSLSPTMKEGNISKWLVKVGQEIKPGDIIAEIETDKATMEIEAVDGGIIKELIFKEGEELIKVNTPIAVIDNGEKDNLPAEINKITDKNINKTNDEKKEILEKINIKKTNLNNKNLITMREAIRDAMA